MNITHLLTQKNIKFFFIKLFTFLMTLISINLYSLLFGKSETLIGVAVVTGFCMLRHLDLGYNVQEASIGIFLLFPFIGLMAYLSQFHILAAILIHFFTVYLLMLLSSLPLAFKTYMPFILCYIFAQSNPPASGMILLRLLGLTVGGLVLAITYYSKHHKKAYKRSIKTIISDIPINSTRNRFILRMAIGITIAAELGSLLHAAKPMWITIVVMSLTQPFTQDTHSRIRYRLIGTVIGSILFLFLFGFLIPSSYSVYFLLLLGFIYGFANEYKIQQIFVTINALGAAMILFDPGTSIPMRLALLILGVSVVLLLDKGERIITNAIAVHHTRPQV